MHEMSLKFGVLVVKSPLLMISNETGVFYNKSKIVVSTLLQTFINA